ARQLGSGRANVSIRVPPGIEDVRAKHADSTAARRPPGIPYRVGKSLVGDTSDLFRIRAASLRGNASECWVWSVCGVAYVCHCAGGWPTVWPTVNRRHSMLTDVGRIVAVPKAVPKTRGLSRRWSPPVRGTRPNSSYAYQCVAAPAGVSGLGLVAGVSVAVSAEIQLSVDRARAMSSRISTRFAPAMAPRIAVTRPISRTPHPRRRSHRRDQPMTTELYD